MTPSVAPSPAPWGCADAPGVQANVNMMTANRVERVCRVIAEWAVDGDAVREIDRYKMGGPSIRINKWGETDDT